MSKDKIIRRYNIHSDITYLALYYNPQFVETPYHIAFSSLSGQGHRVGWEVKNFVDRKIAITWFNKFVAMLKEE